LRVYLIRVFCKQRSKFSLLKGYYALAELFFICFGGLNSFQAILLLSDAKFRLSFRPIRVAWGFELQNITKCALKLTWKSKIEQIRAESADPWFVTDIYWRIKIRNFKSQKWVSMFFLFMKNFQKKIDFSVKCSRSHRGGWSQY
jgi:hypothetical protein